MELHLGCGHLGDSEFVRGFEECNLGHAAFHHADHIRLAWIYVSRHGGREAEVRLLAGIRKMALHANAPQKFLYTTTVAWTRLVAAARGNGGAADKFSDWIALHPELLDRHLLGRYYSPGRLETPEARASWVEPDLASLEI
jgi:hypothetical protein